MSSPSRSSTAAVCSRRAERGMTLIELMVAVVIGLGVTLAVTTVLIASENNKRITTSTNDVDQTGAFIAAELDTALRGAGSGFASSSLATAGALGCKLNVATILPRAKGLPAPFDSTGFAKVSADLRVAPVLIAKNQSSSVTSDVLVVMNGSGAAGGVSRLITGSVGSSTLVLNNAVGLVNDDLVLVSRDGTTDCFLEQIKSISDSTLTLGGTYYAASATLATLASSDKPWVTPLGNATANNLQMTVYTVGDNRTLFSYDLLQATGGDVAQPIAESVEQLHAIYGVDTDGNGIMDGWADPGATGTYDITTVMSSVSTMQKILAVRVSLVLRGNYYDRNGGAVVSPATLTLFSGLKSVANVSLEQTVNLDQQYRYRVLEFTVPLRVMMVLARGS